MKEGYDTTLDLDVYSACRDIHKRQEEGEAMMYIRMENGQCVFTFSGNSEDLLNMLYSAMEQDEVMLDVITGACDYYDILHSEEDQEEEE